MASATPGVRLFGFTLPGGADVDAGLSAKKRAAGDGYGLDATMNSKRQRSMQALPLAAETLAARASTDCGSPTLKSRTSARSSLNSQNSTFSMDGAGAAGPTPSLQAPSHFEAGDAVPPAVSAPLAHYAASSGTSRPLSGPLLQPSALRLSPATAFTPYYEPAAASYRPSAVAAAAAPNPFGSAALNPFGAAPNPFGTALPWADAALQAAPAGGAGRSARRPSVKRGSLDSHASSAERPLPGVPGEGAALVLDGKTAAERRRETLAIQATLPPELKICSSCREIKPREMYHACRAKKDQLQDRCKACRASLDAVRTALARPANAAARPVGALALERAARSAEPFLRTAAAAITAGPAARASCRRASEPVGRLGGPGGSCRRASGPAKAATSALLALSSVREEPASQQYQADHARGSRPGPAAPPPPPWSVAQAQPRRLEPASAFHRPPPRSRLGAQQQPQQLPPPQAWSASACGGWGRRPAAPGAGLAALADPAAAAHFAASRGRWALAALACMRHGAAAPPPTPKTARELATALGLSPAAGLLLTAMAAGLCSRGALPRRPPPQAPLFAHSSVRAPA